MSVCLNVNSILNLSHRFDVIPAELPAKTSVQIEELILKVAGNSVEIKVKVLHDLISRHTVLSYSN